MQYFDKETLMFLMESPQDWIIDTHDKTMTHITGLSIRMNIFSVVVKMFYKTTESEYKVLKLTDFGKKADSLYTFLSESKKAQQNRNKNIIDLLKS